MLPAWPGQVVFIARARMAHGMRRGGGGGGGLQKTTTYYFETTADDLRGIEITAAAAVARISGGK